MPRLSRRRGVAVLGRGDERVFPGRYCTWFRGGESPSSPFAPLNETWLNLYRPSDYVGRGVNRSPWLDESNEPDTRETIPTADTNGDGPRLVEVCINLPGAHTTYRGSPHVAAHVNYLVERAAIGDEDEPPEVPLPDRMAVAMRQAETLR